MGVTEWKCYDWQHEIHLIKDKKFDVKGCGMSNGPLEMSLD